MFNNMPSSWIMDSKKCSSNIDDIDCLGKKIPTPVSKNSRLKRKHPIASPVDDNDTMAICPMPCYKVWYYCVAIMENFSNRDHEKKDSLPQFYQGNGRIVSIEERRNSDINARADDTEDEASNDNQSNWSNCIKVKPPAREVVCFGTIPKHQADLGAGYNYNNTSVPPNAGRPTEQNSTRMIRSICTGMSLHNICEKKQLLTDKRKEEQDMNRPIGHEIRAAERGKTDPGNLQPNSHLPDKRDDQ